MSTLATLLYSTSIVKPTLIMTAAQDQTITQTVTREGARLRRFIARYVVDHAEAEDILQDVFYELVDAYRLMKPIEQAGAWLLRVARNRIIDRFRKPRMEGFSAEYIDSEDELFTWEEFLPDPSAGPEATLARQLMLQQIEVALAELPLAQREVFIAHELEGRSFKDISQQSGIGINTLLSRKHEAVIALRERLQQIYEELP